jgi:hypothetical protein
MTTDDWPENWPDIRKVPAAQWPESIRVIDDEMTALLKLKTPEQLQIAMKRFHMVIEAQGKTIEDVHDLAAASRLPHWRTALEHIRGLALMGTGH